MKITLFILTSLILISASIIYHIFVSFDPGISPFSTFAYLYLTLTIFLGAIIALLLFWFKIYLIDQGKIIASLAPSIRQGVLTALCLVSLLILKTIGILSLWDALAIILTFIFLELFFQSEKNLRKTRDPETN